jgi:hypothetical protein
MTRGWQSMALLTAPAHAWDLLADMQMPGR